MTFLYLLMLWRNKNIRSCSCTVFMKQKNWYEKNSVIYPRAYNYKTTWSNTALNVHSHQKWWHTVYCHPLPKERWTGRGDQLNAKQLKTHFIAQIASQQTTTKQQNIEANTFFAFCDVYPNISVLWEHCVAFESLYEYKKTSISAIVRPLCSCITCEADYYLT